MQSDPCKNKKQTKKNPKNTKTKENPSTILFPNILVWNKERGRWQSPRIRISQRDPFQINDLTAYHMDTEAGKAWMQGLPRDVNLQAHVYSVRKHLASTTVNYEL